MDAPTAKLRTAMTDLQRRLGDDVKVELMEFRADMLDQSGILPA